MGDTGNARDIACPFYRSDKPTKLTISCEGIVPGSSLTHKFNDTPTYDYQIDVYCKSIKRCVRCPIYRAINAKYNKSPLS